MVMIRWHWRRVGFFIDARTCATPRVARKRGACSLRVHLYFVLGTPNTWSISTRLESSRVCARPTI